MVITSLSSFASIVAVRNIASNEEVGLEVSSLDNYSLVGFPLKTVLPLVSFYIVFCVKSIIAT